MASVAAQLGAAGLIGWMWLTERRAGAVRETQLAEAHDRLVAERTSLEVILRTIENSTRVLSALEVGQRQLLELLGRMAQPASSSAVTSSPSGPHSSPSGPTGGGAAQRRGRGS
ncbi:MAG: hypothetical protein ACKVS8_09205 [Phycisphaerales bacterium]